MVAPRRLLRRVRGLARGALPRVSPAATGAAPGIRDSVGPAAARVSCVALALCLLALPAAACRVNLFDGAIPDSLAASPRELPNAYYADPTSAYGHGIMGSVPDARTLVIPLGVWTEDNRCGVRADRIAAGEGHVFEDTAPRRVDLDGDGALEIIAVRSSFTRGAQLAVYGSRDGSYRLLDATPYIGTRFRWLAPAAWEDLDGDGHVELAFVDRPHLAKTLRVWRWRNGGLQPVASLPGVTNHAIGEEVIRGFTRNCGDGPEMVLQSADRTRLVGVRLIGDALQLRDLALAGQEEKVRACSE